MGFEDFGRKMLTGIALGVALAADPASAQESGHAAPRTEQNIDSICQEQARRNEIAIREHGQEMEVLSHECRVHMWLEIGRREKQLIERTGSADLDAEYKKFRTQREVMVRYVEGRADIIKREISALPKMQVAALVQGVYAGAGLPYDASVFGKLDSATHSLCDNEIVHFSRHFDDYETRFAQRMAASPFLLTDPAAALTQTFGEFVEEYRQKNAQYLVENDTSAADEWKRNRLEDLEIILAHMKTEYERIEKDMNLPRIFDLIEDSRAWLLRNIASKEYGEKLALMGFSPEKITEIRTTQTRNIQEVLYRVPIEHGRTSRFNGSSIYFFPEGIAASGGRDADHEFWHMTYSYTDSLGALYNRAWIGNGKFQDLSFSLLANYLDISYGPNNIYYSRSLDELNARKKALEHDMETLGIKKTEEKMTHEHYQKLMEYMKEGKLDRNDMELLILTTEDGVIEVVNGVAVSDMPTNVELARTA